MKAGADPPASASAGQRDGDCFTGSVSRLVGQSAQVRIAVMMAAVASGGRRSRMTVDAASAGKIRRLGVGLGGGQQLDARHDHDHSYNFV